MMPLAAMKLHIASKGREGQLHARSPATLTPRLELGNYQGEKGQRRPTPSHLCGLPPSCNEDAQTTHPARAPAESLPGLLAIFPSDLDAASHKCREPAKLC